MGFAGFAAASEDAVNARKKPLHMVDNPVIDFDAEADIGSVNTTDHLPALCPGCKNTCAMLIETGKRGSRVTCMGCLRWWVRFGDFGEWADS